MTNGKFIYFAGSIRGGRDDQGIYFKIIDLLNQHGSVLTEHVGDKGLGIDGEVLSNRQIHDRDIAWLKKSDCVVAEITSPSLGVGYEIGKASEWGIPILCLFKPGEERLLSAMIAGCKEITVREYQTSIELKDIINIFFRDL